MTSFDMRLDQVLRQAITRLPGDGARFEAEQFLMHVLKRERAWLFAHANDTLEPALLASFEVLLERRIAGEPVAYLTGYRGFWTLDLEVDAATLIPRAETECLVEQALARLPLDEVREVADLGTGSGAIALSIASERPQARVLATDLSEDALTVARRNAHLHALRNVRFAHGSWLSALETQRFHLIASNPPYIASGDEHLSQGDLRFEPMMALASGLDGLDAIRVLTAGAPAHLLPGGWLLLEHGWTQASAVHALMQQHGFTQVQTVQDLEGRDRVTMGCHLTGESGGVG